MSKVQGCDDIHDAFMDFCRNENLRMSTTANVFKDIESDRKKERDTSQQFGVLDKNLNLAVSYLKKIDSQM